MEQQQNIKIIGGGISGLSMALSLQRYGIDYELYEKNAEITYENVGLGISANIFPILNAWGVLNQLKTIGTEIKQFHFVDQHLKNIKSFTIKRPPLSINRKLFYELLKERLNKNNLRLGSKKLATEFSIHDIVISADGISSDTRKQIYPDLKLRDSNQILWRGISKINLDDAFKNAYHDFVGNNLRFAIIHTGADYYSWYIIKEKSGTGNSTSDKELLKSYFKSYHPIVGEVIQQSKNIYFSEMLDISPYKRKNIDWYVKNNLMIGDAMHPTTPNMANGACLAMEDAYILATLLMNKKDSVKAVFLEFQKLRVGKINSIVNQSWRLGKILHQKSRVMHYVIKSGIKISPQWLFDTIYSNVLRKQKVIG